MNIATAIKKVARNYAFPRDGRSRHTIGVVNTLRRSQRVDHADRWSSFTTRVG